MTVTGTPGTGPVVDGRGRPLRALNPFDPGAQAPAPGSAERPDDPGDRRRGPVTRFRGRPGRIALAAVVPVLLVVTWHVLTDMTGVFAPHQMPAPRAVVEAGVELATWANGPDLWVHVQISTQRVLLGFLAGAVIGIAAGAVVGLSRLADTMLSGTLGAFRAIPSLGWVPLLILWIGINEDSKVVLVAIGSFFPVYTTVASALRHVDRHLVEAGRAYGLRGTSLLVRVQLPAATPAVVSGLRLALAQAWLFLVAAELIASSQGLGFLLTDSQNNGRVDRILLALVVLAVLGKATDALIGVVEKRLLTRF